MDDHEQFEGPSAVALTSHCALHEAFLGVPNQMARITIWIANLSNSGTSIYRLFYGWILPVKQCSNFLEPRWTHYGIGKKKNPLNSSASVRLFAYELIANTENIAGLLDQLKKGETLDSACRVNELPIPEKVAELKLVSSIDGGYDYAPPFWHDTYFTLQTWGREKDCPKSPHEEVPCWNLALQLRDKKKLLEIDSSELSRASDDLLSLFSATLKTETGFDLSGGDAVRLGNIEWLAFPALITDETPCVEINAKKSDRRDFEGLQIRISGESKNESERLLINVQTIHSDGVLSNRTIETLWNPSQPIEVPNIPDIGIHVVEISRKESSTPEWRLWYRHAISFIRSVSVDLCIMQGTTTIKSDWLKQLTSSRLKARASKVETFVPYKRESTINSGLPTPTWVETSKQARRLAQIFTPAPSSGKFFPKGWSDGNHGFLSFVEWIQDALKLYRPHRIVLADPYFDEAGIELVARFEEVDTFYVVLTNTQTRGLGDTESRPTTDSSTENQNTTERERRIKTACNQLQPVLTKLNLEILDLRSVGSGTKQLFHDRYLLMYDKEMWLIKGFCLSNSIQGATKKHPFSVVPMTGTLLNDVGEYVSELLSSATSRTSDTKLESLFDSKELVKQNPANHHLNPQKQYDFFEELLDWAKMQGCRTPLLTSAITKAKESGSLHLDSPEIEELKYILPFLAQEKVDEFANKWQVITQLFAHSRNGNNLVSELASAGGSSLADKLIGLLDSKLTPYRSSIEPHKRTVIQDPMLMSYKTNIRRPWAECLRTNIRIGHRYFREPDFRYGYPIRYLFKFLIHSSPSDLISRIDESIKNIVDTDDSDKTLDYRNSPILFNTWLIEFLSKEISEGRTALKLVTALLSSSTSILQSLGVAATLGVLLYEMNLREIEQRNWINGLQNLPSERRMDAWAAMLGELRPALARRDSDYQKHNCQLQKIVSQKLVSAMHDNNVETTQLRGLLSPAGGPLEGSRAEFLHQNILEPLIETGQLKSSDALEHWSTILFEHILGNLHSSSEESETSRPHHFYEDTDKQLTKVAAQLVSDLKGNALTEYLGEIERKCKNLRYKINKAFQRSINYDLWQQGRLALLWLNIYLDLILKYAQENSVLETDISQIVEIRNKYQISDLLQEASYIPEPLIKFRNEVKILDFDRHSSH